MVKKYLKKPIPIEAVQYTGDNFDELQSFAGNDVYIQDGYVFVHTLEGDMKMAHQTGDYLVKGIHGEFYFCEKNIFEESYFEDVDPQMFTSDEFIDNIAVSNLNIVEKNGISVGVPLKTQQFFNLPTTHLSC